MNEGINLLVEPDYASLSRTAAQIVSESVRENPSAAVVVATGDTPIGTYRELAALKQENSLDFSRLQVFQLDEYVGPDSQGENGFLYEWMKKEFLDPLDVPGENVVRFPHDAPDPQGACRSYDEAVRRAGGLDLAILGLGPNGHLGFNEPPADPHSLARVVSLSTESIKSNARYWGNEANVPRAAMTAGMASLLGARRIILLVSGTSKQEILYCTVEGPVTPDVPASLLRMASDITVIADESAWPAADHSYGPDRTSGRASGTAQP